MLWLEHQGNTKTTKGQVHTYYFLGTSIIILETYLQMMIQLWEMRNNQVHGNEEVVKQQKRKAKAAISVCLLYDLQNELYF